MDRNACWRLLAILISVALRKESVDRNPKQPVYLDFQSVALRKESVDRNIKEDVSYNIKETSLSARRAWIEIEKACKPGDCPAVALRKESVDRNSVVGTGPLVLISRSPQGERG